MHSYNRQNMALLILSDTNLHRIDLDYNINGLSSATRNNSLMQFYHAMQQC